MKSERGEITYYPGMFDLVKGLAVVSIVITHTQNLFSKEIFSVDFAAPIRSFIVCVMNVVSLGNGIIPVFFLISGFGFRRVNFKRCVKKQAKYLLKPYALSSVFTTCIHFCSHYFFFRYLPGSIYATLCVLGGYLLGASLTIVISDVVFCSVGSVWFLLALFGAWVILNTLMTWVSERKIPIVVFALVVIGRVIGSAFPIPYCIPQILVGTGYLYAGWIMKKNNWLSGGLSYGKWAIVILLAAISQVFGKYELSGAIWKLGLIDILGAGCMAFVCVWIVTRLSQFEFPLKNQLCMIGRYSLWIICIHTIENQGLPWYLFAERWPYDMFSGFLLLLVIKGGIIYILYRMLIWWNSRKIKKRKMRVQHV